MYCNRIDATANHIDSVLSRIPIDRPLNLDTRKLLYQLTSNIRYDTKQIRECMDRIGENVGLPPQD